MQIQVIQIDDSSPAPLFNIISEPNNWGKSIKKSNSGDAISNTKLLQKDFWAELKDYAKNKSISIILVEHQDHSIGIIFLLAQVVVIYVSQ